MSYVTGSARCLVCGRMADVRRNGVFVRHPRNKDGSCPGEGLTRDQQEMLDARGIRVKTARQMEHWLNAMRRGRIY